MGAGVAQSSLDDLFTAGVLGLTQAARRFDVAGGSLQGRGRTRFLTFAHHYIRKAMIEALRGADLDVYVPRCACRCLRASLAPPRLHCCRPEPATQGWPCWDLSLCEGT